MKNCYRILMFGVVMLFTFSVSQAQVSFSHAIGASYYYSSEASSPGIMYSPRVNILEIGDEMTVSLGTHVGLWFQVSTADDVRAFTYDIPLVAEFNFGHAAHRDTRSGFGGFIGAGYGFNRMGYESSFYASEYNDAKGVVANGGVRFYIGTASFGFRLSYLMNSIDDYANVMSGGVFATFGMN